MEVTVHYSKIQKEATIRCIAENNRYFLGRYDFIRQLIDDHIVELVKRFPYSSGIGTAGYYISVEYFHQEGIDNDDNLIMLNFAVDPAISDVKNIRMRLN